MPDKPKGNISFRELQERMKDKSLDELLEEISVLDSFENESTKSLEGWSAVCTDYGIVAYFGEASDALYFRLDVINRILNS